MRSGTRSRYVAEFVYLGDGEARGFYEVVRSVPAALERLTRLHRGLGGEVERL